MKITLNVITLSVMQWYSLVNNNNKKEGMDAETYYKQSKGKESH